MKLGDSGTKKRKVEVAGLIKEREGGQGQVI